MEFVRLSVEGFLISSTILGVIYSSIDLPSKKAYILVLGFSLSTTNLTFLERIQGITVVETILSPSDLRSILGITLDLTPCLVCPVVTSMSVILLTRRIPRPPQTSGLGDLPISSSNHPEFL